MGKIERGPTPRDMPELVVGFKAEGFRSRLVLPWGSRGGKEPVPALLEAGQGIQRGSAGQDSPGAGIGGIERRRGSWELWGQSVPVMEVSVHPSLCQQSCCLFLGVFWEVMLQRFLDIPSAFP